MSVLSGQIGEITNQEIYPDIWADVLMIWADRKNLPENLGRSKRSVQIKQISGQILADIWADSGLMVNGSGQVVNGLGCSFYDLGTFWADYLAHSGLIRQILGRWKLVWVA